MGAAKWAGLAGAAQGLSGLGMAMFEEAKLRTLEEIRANNMAARDERAATLAKEMADTKYGRDVELMKMENQSRMDAAKASASARSADRLLDSIDTELAALARTDTTMMEPEKAMEIEGRIAQLRAWKAQLTGMPDSGGVLGGATQQGLDPNRLDALAQLLAGKEQPASEKPEEEPPVPIGDDYVSPYTKWRATGKHIKNLFTGIDE